MAASEPAAARPTVRLHESWYSGHAAIARWMGRVREQPGHIALDA